MNASERPDLCMPTAPPADETAGPLAVPLYDTSHLQRIDIGRRALRVLQEVRALPDLLDHVWFDGDTVQFPLERSLGRFWWRQDGGWELLGAAQGSVRIPPECDVRFANESNALTSADIDPLLIIPQLVRLDLTGRWVDDALMQQFVALPRLVTLAMHHGRLTADGVRALELARDLTVLMLDATVTEASALEALPLLPNLRRFTLQRTALPQATAETLGATSTLTALSLRDADLSDERVRALRGLSLRTLDIGRNPLTDRALPGLVSSLLESVQTLALDGTSITGAGALHLRSCANLHELDLSSTAVDTDRVAHLLHTLPLEHLALNWTPVDAGVFVRTHARTLTSLELRGNHWPKAAWSLLATACPLLARLDLAYSSVDDEHLAHIADLQHLTHLNLRSATITDAAIEPLLRMPHLEWLGVQGTLLTRDGINAIHAAKPALMLG